MTGCEDASWRLMRVLPERKHVGVHEDDEVINQEAAGKMVANLSVSVVRTMFRHSRLYWLTRGTRWQSAAVLSFEKRFWKVKEIEVAGSFELGRSEVQPSAGLGALATKLWVAWSSSRSIAPSTCVVYPPRRISCRRRQQRRRAST